MSMVNRVDHVDAVLDEGALTPADHLAAEADGAAQLAFLSELEILEHERVEHAEARADAVLGDLGQVVAALILVVVEVGDAGERAPGAPVQAGFGRDLEGGGDRVAFVVLEVAVVTVGGEAARRGDLRRGARHAAGGGAAARADGNGAEREVLRAKQRIEPGLGNQVRVLLLGAPRVAQRHRGVDAAGELAARELEGLGGRGHQQGQGNGGGQRGTGDQPVL
jgi:hypothetical protein